MTREATVTSWPAFMRKTSNANDQEQVVQVPTSDLEVELYALHTCYEALRKLPYQQQDRCLKFLDEKLHDHGQPEE